jgi:O-antigen ligase
MGARLSRAIVTAFFACAAILLVVVSTSLFRLDRVPLLIVAVIVSIGGLAAVRPGQALLAVAALVPLANYLFRGWNGEVAWAETLVLAFGAGWCIRRLFRRDEWPALGRLRLPLIVFTSVIAASVVVQLSIDHTRLGTAEFLSAMWRFFAREYFISGSDRYLHAAAFLLEGALLFDAAVRLASADARFMPRLAGTLVASTAAAAAINLLQLVVSAARFENFWGMLAQHIATARFNVHYGDVNAAGSVFAMLLLVAGGLSVAATRRSRPWWICAAVFLALGLWMSGSRTAMFVCPVALAGLGVAAARKQMNARGRLATLVACCVLLVGALAVVYAPTRGNQKASSIAAKVRVEMARTTGRMVAEAPLFGIGLGQFYQRTGEFSSPELLTLFPPAQHENAHNNFFQILAETGLVGLAAFLWLLCAALVLTVQPLTSNRRDALAWGVLAGSVAFLLTCFGGHPLLTREAAYTFWIVLGMAAGHARPSNVPPVDGTWMRWLRPAAIVVLAGLIVSIPFRIASAKARADFEHLGIGLSTHWETSPDGTRYRSAGDSAVLFVPAGSGFRFHVRTLSGVPERLELRLRGRVANVVPLLPNEWTLIAVPAASTRKDSRFIRMELRVLDATGRQVTLWITKVEQLER